MQANGTLQPNVADFPPAEQGHDPRLQGRGWRGRRDLLLRPAVAAGERDGRASTTPTPAAADRNLITSVAIDRGEDLGDCPANRNDARVRIVDGNTEAAQDARFFVWFEE